MSGSNFFMSQIDATVPTPIRAYTADVRRNFARAKSEIEWLASLFEGGVGGFLTDAPQTGDVYGRSDGAWVVVPGGGTGWDVIDGGTF